MANFTSREYNIPLWYHIWGKRTIAEQYTFSDTHKISVATSYHFCSYSTICSSVTLDSRIFQVWVSNLHIARKNSRASLIPYSLKVIFFKYIFCSSKQPFQKIIKVFKPKIAFVTFLLVFLFGTCLSCHSIMPPACYFSCLTIE